MNCGRAWGLSAALSVLCVAAPTWAQESENVDLEESVEGSEDAAPGDDLDLDEEDVAKDAADEKKSDIEVAPLEEELPETSPVEEAGKTYYFVGLRYRGIILPKFMMRMFADGGSTVYVNGVGPEFGIRKDDFEIQLSAWYAGYGTDDIPFKSKSDPDTAWELVNSDLWTMYLTADFLWSQPLSSDFAINYGGGAGFGIVFGDLFRNEAYFPPGVAANPDGDGLVRCTDVGEPDGNQCPPGEYGDPEPSWANGGSKPILFPWLTVQTGVRYKPHRNFVARLDLGFGTSGFFFGIGADYGL